MRYAAAVLLLALQSISPAIDAGSTGGEHRQLQFLDCQEYFGITAWQPTKTNVDHPADRGIHFPPKVYSSLTASREIRPPEISHNIIPLASHLIYTQTTSAHL